MNTVRATRPTWTRAVIAVAVIFMGEPALAQNTHGVDSVKVATIPIHREASVFEPTPTPTVEAISATPRAWMTVPPIKVQTVRISPTIDAPRPSGDASWPNR